MDVDLIHSFERHLDESGLAAKTIESYGGDVKGLLADLQQMGVEEASVFKRFHFVSYKSHLVDNAYTSVRALRKSTRFKHGAHSCLSRDCRTSVR